MPERSPLWRGWENAEIYDRFVHEHGIYDALNAHLVGLARLEDARRVLDLGCGTGATTMACLSAIPADAEIVGVDGSAEMVDVARHNILDPRARFVVAAAGRVHESVAGPFDRCVCNAAFWQFPGPAPVLGALSRVLSPGARLVFNVPAERVTGEAAPVHPFQVALARVVREWTGQPYAPSNRDVDPESLERVAAAHGFEPAAIERFTWEGEQAELMELMTIPAMIDPLTPGLSGSERLKVLDEARRGADPRERVRVPWVFFALRFTGAAGSPPGSA
ncbi:MAG: class I SAM-dependent methyltransferase [Myxococcota bacterium]